MKLMSGRSLNLNMDRLSGKLINTVFIVCFLSTLIDDAQLLLTIERGPTNMTLIRGTSGTLDCIGHSSTNHNANYRCSWLKDGNVMFVGEGKRRLFYDWLADYHLGNCSIVLKNADVRRHQGKWICTVTNTEMDETVSSPTAIVTVLVPPTLPEIQDSAGNELSEVTVVESKVQQLHCISRHGNPPPMLHWMRNLDDISIMATYYNNSEPYVSTVGTPVEESGPRASQSSNARLYTAGSWLSLTANRSHDGAVVTCFVRHPGYEIDEDFTHSTSITLNVIYAPLNASGESNVTVTVNDEGGVELDCPLVGKPEPEYSWFWKDDDGQQSYQIGWQKQIVLDNLSNGMTEGGYYCKAFTMMDDQNLTAFSSMFVLSPAVLYDDDYVCRENLLVLIVTSVIGLLAFASFIMEVTLIIYFRCQPSERSGPTQNLFHELYNTRGRKMALVHVRAEHNDKGSSGWTLHISSFFVSIVLVILSMFTLTNYGVSVFFCYIPDTCDCTFLNPAVLLTIVLGSVVILLQFIFFVGFCLRKMEERKYRNYARKREDVAGYIATESPSKQSITITPASSRPQSSKTQEKQNGKSNGKSDDALPGSVAV